MNFAWPSAKNTLLRLFGSVSPPGSCQEQPGAHLQPLILGPHAKAWYVWSPFTIWRAGSRVSARNAPPMTEPPFGFLPFFQVPPRIGFWGLHQPPIMG